MNILNLTQHTATAEQTAQGVVDPEGRDKELFSKLLTFLDIPSKKEMEARADKLVAHWCGDYMTDGVMIGGAPFFMPILERKFREQGVDVHYAFSRRESVDSVQPDGTVTKTSVFKHVGFVTVRGFDIP